MRSSSLIHRLARYGHSRQPTGLGIADRCFGSALGADGAVSPPVQVEACLACGIACLLQLSRHMIAPAVVHLIGSLAAESGVGEPRIVLINVECHETPERGGTVGGSSEQAMPRPASRRTAIVLAGSNLSASRQDRIRREKLSMTARRKALLPSSSLMTVVSMCHAWFG